MGKQDPCFSPDQLARLLNLGLVDEDMLNRPDSQHLTGALEARLAGPLPMRAEAIELIPVLLGQVKEQLLPCRGQPVGELLFDAESSEADLLAIQDYGKRLAAIKDNHACHFAGVAIYYAAIASALLFLGTRITSYDDEALALAFGKLVEKPWMPMALSRHLAEARRLCRSRQG